MLVIFWEKVKAWEHHAEESASTKAFIVHQSEPHALSCIVRVCFLHLSIATFTSLLTSLVTYQSTASHRLQGP